MAVFLHKVMSDANIADFLTQSIKEFKDKFIYDVTSKIHLIQSWGLAH